MRGSGILGRVEKSIEIGAPPEKVWEMLAMDRMPEWTDVGEVESAKFISEVRNPEDKHRVGAVAHITEKRWEYDLEVTESLKNEKIAFHSKGRYVYTLTFILKPVQDGTKLALVGVYEPEGILGKARLKLASALGAAKMAEQMLEKLKSILEEKNIADNEISH